jgi:hypothetical protein
MENHNKSLPTRSRR